MARVGWAPDAQSRLSDPGARRPLGPFVDLFGVWVVRRESRGWGKVRKREEGRQRPGPSRTNEWLSLGSDWLAGASRDYLLRCCGLGVRSFSCAIRCVYDALCKRIEDEGRGEWGRIKRGMIARLAATHLPALTTSLAMPSRVSLPAELLLKVCASVPSGRSPNGILVAVCLVSKAWRVAARDALYGDLQLSWRSSTSPQLIETFDEHPQFLLSCAGAQRRLPNGSPMARRVERVAEGAPDPREGARTLAGGPG